MILLQPSMRFSYEPVFQNIITHNLHKITVCLYGVKIGTGYFEDAHHCFMKKKNPPEISLSKQFETIFIIFKILINCLIIYVTINCVFVALAAKVLTEANNVIKEN